jgi:hypothetical protein
MSFNKGRPEARDEGQQPAHRRPVWRRRASGPDQGPELKPRIVGLFGWVIRWQKRAGSAQTRMNTRFDPLIR